MAERKRAAKKKGYKMPPPIPQGEVLSDVQAKKKWRIGPSIGVGGFGEIYSASDNEASGSKSSMADNPYVVKIEPHENGPLFVEKHFYSRNTNKDDISNFIKSHKLSSLGMPMYHGSGSHMFKGENFRYLVLERYGKDLWSLFKENGRSFPLATVFQLGLQMLDVLEYIHSKGYVHADLKGANILLGRKKGFENQAYLLDYGLAKRVTEGEFKPDPKGAHNGTIEYTSRDAHLGVPTMRGDLEILAYNMLQWIVGELPWEKEIKDPKKVQQAKEDFMMNVKKNITNKYPNVPDALIEFFEHITKLKPKETPDYSKFKKIFESYLKTSGRSRTSKLEFSSKATKTAKTTNTKIENSPRSPKKTGRIVKRKSSDSLLVNTIKKTKLNRVSGTPPAKQNHVNSSTQTSLEKRKSPRNVTFDSPVVSQVIASQEKNGRRVKTLNYNENSPDMFDDSFEGNPKKRKGLVKTKKLTVAKKVVKKTSKTGRSWKDAPTVVNGKRPPV